MINGKYKVLQLVGEGAYGRVFKATYQDKLYAVKIIVKS